MCTCYIYLFYYVAIFFFVFLVVWLLTNFKRTDPISFVSAPNPLHFCSESVIIYIRFRIRIRSLSAPLRIRWKHMIEDMVKAKSNPIRSVYIPTRLPRGRAWNLWMPRLLGNGLLASTILTRKERKNGVWRRSLVVRGAQLAEKNGLIIFGCLGAFTYRKENLLQV
jgi:hypothetical protein